MPGAAEPPDYGPWLWGAGAGLAAAATLALLFRRKDPSSMTTHDVRLLDLDHAAFPGQGGPDAAVIIPPDWSPAEPLEVCLYLHGFNGCVSTAAGELAAPCRPGGPPRNPSRLGSQLARSGARTIVVVPELRRDEATGDPGRLASPGFLEAMLDEVFARLPEVAAGRTSADLTRLALMAHSGGYQAAAALVRRRPPALRSVVLLDALYGNEGDFAAWVEAHAAGFDGTPMGHRFASLYTGGTTASRSASLAARLKPVLARAGVGGAFRASSDASAWGALDLAPLGVLVQRTSLSHGDTSREGPVRFWSAGW